MITEVLRHISIVIWVVLVRTPRVIKFFFLLGLYLRDFAARSDGVSPVDVDIVFLLLFWTVCCHVFITIIVVVVVVLYFLYLAFYTHVFSCVHGEINHS
jgi:hypothetical protein